MIQITLDDLDYADRDQVLQPVGTPLEQDGDQISFSQELIHPLDRIEIVFATAPEVTWWKELQVINAEGNLIAALSCQDFSHGPICTIISEPNFIESKRGHRLAFTWG